MPVLGLVTGQTPEKCGLKNIAGQEIHPKERYFLLYFNNTVTN
jgi:hypothetical protein